MQSNGPSEIWLGKLLDNISLALEQLSDRADRTNVKIQDQTECVRKIKNQIAELRVGWQQEHNEFKVEFAREIASLKVKSKVWFQLLTAIPGIIAAIILLIRG